VLGAGQPGLGAELAVVTLQRNLPVAALLAITTFRSEPAVLAMVLGGVVLLRVLQIPFAALAAPPPSSVPGEDATRVTRPASALLDACAVRRTRRPRSGVAS
jgi:hypothetical protein